MGVTTGFRLQLMDGFVHQLWWHGVAMKGCATEHPHLVGMNYGTFKGGLQGFYRDYTGKYRHKGPSS